MALNIFTMRYRFNTPSYDERTLYHGVVDDDYDNDYDDDDDSDDNSLVCGVGMIERKKEKERIFLFNDALNTFYLRLYGVRHMVKDHSDSEKGNPLPPHRLLLSINSKGSFICTIPQTG